MSVSKRELFDKLTRMKQRNRSQCDRMKNLNTRFRIIQLVLSENHGFGVEDAVLIDDYYKCKWYNTYKGYDIVDISMEYGSVVKEYKKLDNHVKVRSKRIQLLRFWIGSFGKDWGW